MLERPKLGPIVTIIVAVTILVALILYDIGIENTDIKRIFVQLLCLGFPMVLIILVAIIKKQKNLK
jgi:hypothetical protein